MAGEVGMRTDIPKSQRRGVPNHSPSTSFVFVPLPPCGEQGGE